MWSLQKSTFYFIKIINIYPFPTFLDMRQLDVTGIVQQDPNIQFKWNNKSLGLSQVWLFINSTHLGL